MKPLIALLPRAALIALACGTSAQAQEGMGPYSVRMSQDLGWQDNLFRVEKAAAQSDWLSTTGIQAALDEEFGRQRVKADANIGVNRYRDASRLNNTSYNLGGTWLWSAPDVMSGELGAQATSRRSVYGADSEAAIGPVDALNIERMQRMFFTARIGGPRAWTFGVGLDGQRRKYSEPSFDNREVRQASASTDARYQASPDLSLGTTLRLTDGKFPNFDAQSADNFRTKSLDASTDWQVSGASRLSVRLGHTNENHDRQADQSFWTGSAQWSWAPTGRITVLTGLRRDNNANQVGKQTAGNLTQQSLNTSFDASVKWAASSKIEVSLTGQKVRRNFESAVVNSVEVSGVDHTQMLGIGVRYAVSRSIDLSCKFSQEQREVDASLSASASRAFKARSVTCGGALLLN